FFNDLTTSGLEYEAAAAPSFIETIVNIFPSNAVAPMVNANMLQVIVIALFFGFGTIAVGEKGKAFADFVESANAVSMYIMDAIIKLSPIGVFCLITPVVAENGPAILGDLLTVLAVAYLAYILHMVIVYSTTVKVLAGMNPVKFFKGMLPAIMMAFSSASSVGTLPLNLECVQKMGAKKDVASFILPLGATINMDGTAIYQGVCSIFIATCFGIDLTLGQQLTIILTATLASIGTAGVPGAGMIMLAMVLQSVGLPVEGIALVAGIDRIFDMGRTTVNITGDAACTLCVSKMEEKRAASK
ncbi:MAG: dicarboxylate/amino acid:cation symporter, partial [Anaerotignum sp.]